MCYQTSVVDRAMDSEYGSGPHVPGTPQITTRPDEILGAIRQLPNDVLKDTVIVAKRLIDRTTAELSCLVAELDSRGLTEIDDGLSTAPWLVDRCRMTRAEASGAVKSARALAHMPTVTRAALSGDVPPRSVRMLTKARDRHPEEFAHHEAVFADVAGYLSVRDLKQAIGHWDQQVDHDQALDDTRDDSDHRELFFNQTYLGRWDVSGSFGVADGTVIHTALLGFVQASYLDPTDARSMPQRLADAVVGIHRFWLDHNTTVKTSGGEKPHITVVVDYRTLTGGTNRLPELDGYAIDIEDMHVSVEAESAPHPERIQTIRVTMTVTGEVTDKQMASLSRVAARCKIHNTLADSPTIELDMVIAG